MEADDTLTLTLEQTCKPGARRGDFPNCTRRSVQLPRSAATTAAPQSPGLERLGGDTAWCASWTHGLYGRNASMFSHLWQKARADAGLPPLDAAALAERRQFMLSFFTTASHSATAWPGPARCGNTDPTLVYVPIWKAASVVLTDAAQSATTRHGVASLDNGLYAFTFVREPLEHLLSGAAEAAWRLSPAATDAAPWSADDFVAALLDARYPGAEHQHTTVHRHYWPMSSALAWWPLAFVGRLEHRHDDWRALRAAHCAAPNGEAVWGSALLKKRDDDASADSLGVRAALLELLASRPPLRRAVCRLLTPDYRCFGYDQTSCEAGLVRGKPLEPKARLKEELRPLLLGVGAVVLVLLAPALWVARRADRRQRQEAGGVKML